MPGFNPNVNATVTKDHYVKNSDGMIPCPQPDRGKAFKFKSHTTRHMMTHTAIGFYQCPTCKLRFRRHDGLTRHVREKHSKTAPQFKCTFCSKTYRHKNTLKAHIHHKQTGKNVLYACTLCTKKFQSKKNLTYHLSTHSNTILIECDECGEKFMNPWSKTRHKQKKVIY